MIRRKLTQLEVTLDDTKELDDLLITCKPVVQGLAAASSSSTTAISSAPASSVPSYLAHKNSFYQKHFLAKQTDSSQNTDSIHIESAASTVGSTSTAANIESISTESNSAEVGFNPQPYNPSNRFQLNQESQQLR